MNGLNNTIIVVNDEPYCIWEVDLKERNKEFLEGIDEDYFDYICPVYNVKVNKSLQFSLL